MSELRVLLDRFRSTAKTVRELGTYFEELTVAYLRHEPLYAALYDRVWTYAQWADEAGIDKRDAGIDLVARTHDGELHAIQCKCFEETHKVAKSDIDSFFTASGKKPFVHRLVVTTASHWTDHAEDALRDQHVPVSKIDLADLERSVLDWSRFVAAEAPVFRPRKNLLPHQKDAVDATLAGLGDGTHPEEGASGKSKFERGKLIMACGTGKTFTSLKAAEALVGEGGRVLFLVPSLALLSQTLTEWTQESGTPLRNFAVCSDSDVGKKRKKNVDDDLVRTFVHELQYPATTDAGSLAKHVEHLHDDHHMTVVYATYHSIGVVHDAQHEHGMAAFDLVVCDEAHRTTGAKFEGEDESQFVRVHDADYVRARKRLYMTATPRIYGDVAKATAERDDVALFSMDDEDRYGPQLHLITFSEAVKRGLLVDYKVVVLAIEEAHVSRRIQQLLKDPDNQLRVDDASKIIGCWKALSKYGLEESLADDVEPMKRAVAFCQVIEASLGAKTHKVSSKNIASMFQAVVEAYRESADPDEALPLLRCEAEHVDGSMNASEKEEKIAWLKADAPAPSAAAHPLGTPAVKAFSDPATCRVLTNVRCLSEGVDVPALDAVLFLTPRSSQIDVVQSVGRVMRKAPGKTRGYVILPVVIPAGVEPHEALNDNQTYKVVWQVLQALRSHDDRFDAMINKLDLIGKDPSKMEIVAISDRLPKRKTKPTAAKEKSATFAAQSHVIGAAKSKKKGKVEEDTQTDLVFDIGEVERAIYAKLVQKVGNRHHWEDWAKDIATIASRHIDRIQGILENPKNERERDAFERFAHELRDDLNDSLSDGEIVEMLAQHLVTKPVFDALFSGHSFASKNPISVAMTDVLEVLQEHHLDKEASQLADFYDSVKLRAEGIESAAGKQKIVVELYDKFFRNAFPKMSERLGIVYTPLEIVDFILHSVDHLLRTEFDQTLSSEGVHILDPFTGTGTFLTRLLQSGLIDRKALPRKYREEIHANELVLLAYYIAAINIEATYHDLVGGNEYVPFEGICLTDTFQLYEKEDLVAELLVDNSARRVRQKKLDIRVILGNPPYSVGQSSQNDNNQNVAYPHLDARIGETYAARSSAVMKNALYDSYVRAIRWASDRVGQSGIVGFVTNAGFLEANSADGLRKCLAEEFSSLYVFHLRGNARTSGELRRKEKDNVFGMGSRAPVAISLFVKNPKSKQTGRIYFRDVGDYLTREDKLTALSTFRSVEGVTESGGWTSIEPDEHGDWLKQRDSSFEAFIEASGKSPHRVFELHSNGVKTNRDWWAVNFSREALIERMQSTIDFYNAEVARFQAVHGTLDTKAKLALVDDFIDTDPKKISWDRPQKGGVARGRTATFDESAVVRSTYRPFNRQWLYFDGFFNNCVYKMPSLFPPTASSANRVIGVSASESRAGFAVHMSDVVPSLHAVDMVGSQYFPLYVYDTDTPSTESDDDEQTELFDQGANAAAPSARRDGITDAGLEHFRSAYPGETITKEDVFYYVYGILHSPEYRQRYADNLGKELPRIPRMKKATDFWAFSRAGRELGELHVGYEKVDEHPDVKVEVKVPVKAAAGKKTTGDHFRVEKMKFGKAKVDGKTVKDRSVIHYNAFVTVSNIPEDAYDYVVNGKPAIEWVMERQAVTKDKDSGIVKDANDWAHETMGDPRYPLSLLLRVIHVSVKTNAIVASLPKLDILET